ncbi:efflux RND transporter periplasmic adaptor subunit [Ferruginibacter sp.]|uniref:efflux RND transporter periplasmic adaptor subunit n=1 Tax=Ferruginibacter sp. TaxID=1940288 RepID=UPI0019CB0DA5|nr:efflux RND transporter periplasmic adaptor subunit [Ferruginibacter sp.]MBC7625779.1 efflux RND transporter periplasmic adaptor subunit [Ferruginibacter sp.]
MDKKIEKKFWNSKRIIWIIGSTLVVSLLVYQLIFADKRSSLNVDKEKITVSEVTQGIFDEFIVVSGVVQPIKTYRIDAIEGGYVKEKVIEGGTTVKAGDVILKLDNNRLQMEFVQQETEINRLINDLQNTRLKLKTDKFGLQRTMNDVDYQLSQAKDYNDRNEKLFKDKVISELEYLKTKRDYEKLKNQQGIEVQSQNYQNDNSKLQVVQLESTLQHSQKNLQLMKENLNNLVVKAPVGGLLSSIEAEVGSSIVAGQNIGQIDDLNGFKMRAGVDEHYISRIFVGLKATMEFSNQNYELVISKVYPEVKAGRFEVDMTFAAKNPDGIRRGQSASIRMELGKSAKAILIPVGGFFSETGGNWVYVMDASGKKAVKRNITLGRRNPEYFEVLDGVKPGEKVITSSYENYGKNEVLQF